MTYTPRSIAICAVLLCSIASGMYAQVPSTSEANSRLELITRVNDIDKKVNDLKRESKQKSDAAKFLDVFSLLYRNDPNLAAQIAQLFKDFPDARIDQDVRDILAAYEKELEKNPHPQEEERNLDSATDFWLREQTSVRNIDGNVVVLDRGTVVRRLSIKGDTFSVIADGVNGFDVPRDKLCGGWRDPIFSQSALAMSQQKQQEAARLSNLARSLATNTANVLAQAQQARQAEAQQQLVQQQVQVQTAIKPTYSRSQEGIPEHTYEITQDHTIVVAGGIRIRLRRGEQYHGRILVDHAEIDIDGISYPVPSGILRPRD